MALLDVKEVEYSAACFILLFISFLEGDQNLASLLNILNLTIHLSSLLKHPRLSLENISTYPCQAHFSVTCLSQFYVVILSLSFQILQLHDYVKYIKVYSESINHITNNTHYQPHTPLTVSRPEICKWPPW